MLSDIFVSLIHIEKNIKEYDFDIVLQSSYRVVKVYIIRTSLFCFKSTYGAHVEDTSMSRICYCAHAFYDKRVHKNLISPRNFNQSNCRIANAFL